MFHSDPTEADREQPAKPENAVGQGFPSIADAMGPRDWKPLAVTPGRRRGLLDPNDVVRGETHGRPAQAVGAHPGEFKPIQRLFRCDPVHSFQVRF